MARMLGGMVAGWARAAPCDGLLEVDEPRGDRDGLQRRGWSAVARRCKREGGWSAGVHGEVGSRTRRTGMAMRTIHLQTLPPWFALLTLRAERTEMAAYLSLATKQHTSDFVAVRCSSEPCCLTMPATHMHAHTHAHPPSPQTPALASLPGNCYLAETHVRPRRMAICTRPALNVAPPCPLPMAHRTPRVASKSRPKHFPAPAPHRRRRDHLR